MDLYYRRRQLGWAGLKVGIVVTAAVVILFLIVFFSGATATIFRRHVKLYSHFDNVGGLRNGSPVWILGVEAGEVDAIDLVDTAVNVTLFVRQDLFRLIRTNARARIQSMGLLGDKYVEIEPGSYAAPPSKPGSVIQGVTTVDMEEIIRTSSQSMEDVRLLIKRTEMILAQITNGKGTIGRLVNDPELYLSMRNSFRTTEEFMQYILSSRGTIRRLIDNPALYNEMTASLHMMNAVGDSLTNGRGTLGRLLNDGRLYENIDRTVANVNELSKVINDGNGKTAGDSVDNSLHGLIANLNSLITDLQKRPDRYFKIEIF